MNEETYLIGECKICVRYKALMNNVCADCASKIDLPDFMKDLMGRFENENNKSEDK